MGEWQVLPCRGRDKWESGKSIRSIDTGHASVKHGAKPDSDLAHPPGGDHPATQQASPGVPTRSAARRGRSAARQATTNFQPVLEFCATFGGSTEIEFLRNFHHGKYFGESSAACGLKLSRPRVGGDNRAVAGLPRKA